MKIAPDFNPEVRDKGGKSLEETNETKLVRPSAFFLSRPFGTVELVIFNFSGLKSGVEKTQAQ